MTNEQIPLVDYLVLSDGQPHLETNECVRCSARYFDRRNACAACSGTEFRKRALARDGHVHTFTIVTKAAAGVEVPFALAIVDCDGILVSGKLVHVEPDPRRITIGMPVRLTTYSLGRDDAGTEAVGFAFEPMPAANVDEWSRN